MYGTVRAISQRLMAGRRENGRIAAAAAAAAAARASDAEK